MLNQDKINQALQKLGITSLNDMQQSVLEAGTKKDLVLLSPTGSGKTLAFLLPLLPVLVPEAGNCPFPGAGFTDRISLPFVGNRI